MDHFTIAWAKTGRAEGGYVNHPDDPGGETNHGITLAVARAHGWMGSMKTLPLAKATEIARLEYWQRLRLDEVALISPPIAYEMFDTNLNFWAGAAVEFLQRSLNALNRGTSDYPDLLVDGRMGDASIKALASLFRVRPRDAQLLILRCLNGLQLTDYLRQVETNERKESFFAGWVLQRVVI